MKPINPFMETKLITHDEVEVRTEATQGHKTEAMDTKRCPFCAEKILELAIKCRHCGEFLDGSGGPSRRARGKGWYFATPTVVFALLCFGPLALPLVWLNPRYKATTKAVITGIVIAATVLCSYLMGAAYRQMMSQFSGLGI